MSRQKDRTVCEATTPRAEMPRRPWSIDQLVIPRERRVGGLTSAQALLLPQEAGECIGGSFSLLTVIVGGSVGRSQVGIQDLKKASIEVIRSLDQGRTTARGARAEGMPQGSMPTS